MNKGTCIKVSFVWGTSEVWTYFLCCLIKSQESERSSQGQHVSTGFRPPVNARKRWAHGRSMWFTKQTELLTHCSTHLTVDMQKKKDGCFFHWYLLTLWYIFLSLTQMKSQLKTNVWRCSPSTSIPCRREYAGLRMKPGPSFRPSSSGRGRNLLLFVLRHTNKTHFARAVNEETSDLAVLHLINRTFLALDIYCGSRGQWTSCKRHRSIQCQGPEAPCLSVTTSLFTLK